MSAPHLLTAGLGLGAPAGPLLTLGLGPFGVGPVAGGLLEALADFLDEAAAIQEAVAGTVWQAEAPPPEALPYVVFSVEETANLLTFKPGCAIETTVIRFYCRGGDAAAASALAATVKAALLGGPNGLGVFVPPARLTFADGREIGRYSLGPGGVQLDPDRAPGGVDSWVAHFPVTFKVARG